MSSKRYVLIIILLLVTTFFSWKFYLFNNNHSTNFNISNFPRTIGQWTSEDLPIGNIDLAFSDTKEAFLRRYTNNEGNAIYLYITYSPHNPKAINPPEISYPGTNISILDKGKDPIIISSLRFLLKVNWLLIDNNKRQEIVYYWFKVGGSYTSSYWKQQGLIAFNNVMNKKTGSALIRVSTDITGNRQKSTDLINEFIDLLVPALSQYLP